MTIRLVLLLAGLALAGCKNQMASVAQTNASANAQLEVINQTTPEDSRSIQLGAAPDAGKQPSQGK